MSNMFVWNIYEKSFTPYFAALAPKHYVHRHQIQRKPNKVSKFWQDSRSKSIMRFVKKHILNKSYWFHFGVILCTINI